MSEGKTATKESASHGAFIVSETWGQPPASHYRFSVEGDRMFGFLISSKESSSADSHKPASLSELQAETGGWDSLSDEAFLDFEDSLE
jgi:hypothetical protein